MSEGKIARSIDFYLTFNSAPICFNPLTVLGDLISTVDYRGGSSEVWENHILNESIKKHPFFMGEFKTMIDEVNSGAQPAYVLMPFFNAVLYLKQAFHSNAEISMSQFEVLRQFHRLTFATKIKFREENPWYQFQESPSMQEYCAKFGKDNLDEQFQYVGLSYNDNFNLQEMFRHNGSLWFTMLAFVLLWHILYQIARLTFQQLA